MDYPIKTLSQLRPILMAFRKSAGMTQAMMASHLGVTQQTYAQLEANPASASLERLFKVLSVLNVDLTLSPRDLKLGAVGRAEQTSRTTRLSDGKGARVAHVTATQPAASKRGNTSATDSQPPKSVTPATLAKRKAKVSTKRRANVDRQVKALADISKRENW